MVKRRAGGVLTLERDSADPSISLLSTVECVSTSAGCYFLGSRNNRDGGEVWAAASTPNLLMLLHAPSHYLNTYAQRQ